MRRTSVAKVVVLHPDRPPLSARDRARLAMIDLLRSLDPASQRVLVDQLTASRDRVRPYGPAARLLREGVAWRRGEGTRTLVAPAARRVLLRAARR